MCIRDRDIPAPKSTPPPSEAEIRPLRGPAARVVVNMQSSLEVPTATSVRTVPAKLLIDNRVVINNHLARSRGGKVSFTHIIGYAPVSYTHLDVYKRQILVRAADNGALRSVLITGGLLAEPTTEGGLTVKTHDIVRVGELAFAGGIPLHELRPLASDLEDLFFKLTAAPEHRNRNLGAPPTGAQHTQDGGSI